MGRLNNRTATIGERIPTRYASVAGTTPQTPGSGSEPENVLQQQYLVDHDGVYVMPLDAPVASGEVTVSVTDSSGNTNTQVRTFKKE